jgi:hypothetical protein
MSVITINPATATAPLAAGQRRRVVGDAVISAYINELAGSAHAEIRAEEQPRPAREDAPRVREIPEAIAA